MLLLEFNLTMRILFGAEFYKEAILEEIMANRAAFRQYLSRNQGEAAEAANADSRRQLLIRQGDGRYLYMQALRNREISQAIRTPPADTNLYEWMAIKERMAMLLTEEIFLHGYDAYLQRNEDIRGMDLADKVSFIFM